MHTIQTKLLVLGGGPGGYVAAIRAGQLGIQTTLVERRALGGVCLNVGCIPSKALIHAANTFANVRDLADQPSRLGIRVEGAAALDLSQAVAWKDGIVERLTGGVGALLKRQKVQVVEGWARIVDGKTVEVLAADGAVTHRIACEHLLLACGSLPVELAVLPFDQNWVISSTEALSPASLPERLVVVGGGYIGLELGIVYRKLGVKVTVVEAAERILPAYDAELTKPVQARLVRLGIELRLGSKVIGPARDAAGAAIGVQIRPAADESAALDSLPADRVLVAVGRRPRTAGYGLESLQLTMQGGAVQIDARCMTSMRNVWAIGDLVGEPMLAHRAMAQGEIVAETIAGKVRRFEPAQIPAVCFTDPEVVSVGQSPEQARETGRNVLTAQFPLAANGRAMTLEDTDGFIRVVADRETHRILGWQAVGGHVAELAAAFSQSIEMGAVLEDVAFTMHAHPTLGEAIQETALRALGHALHV